jgi:hypothetical protein|tara:strand:- start:15847 stop:16179 length:333 start_codon:yes stop_codon:yes gene_type:complete
LGPGSPATTALFITLLLAIDPAFHTDDSVDGLGFRKSVVDGYPQGLQGDFPFPVPLGPRDIGTSETTCTANPDPLRSKIHGSLECTLHGAPETDPALQLDGHVFGHQLSV